MFIERKKLMRGRRGRGCGGQFLFSGEMLIPSILIILKKKSIHGYSLIEDLESIGIDTSLLHPSIVYRTLRMMEMHGLVSSDWNTEGTGPARRIYTITDTGKGFLREWCLKAKRDIEMMEKLIKEAEGGE
ncbi:MAG: PadR family transcriptional regulator, regulatory protein PadR [Pseudothermotoga sp.]|jgi:poly-beta-hydroxybutyrate-responsive repressor|nr:PadR family transcriptional regulator, regulatory protein PadR [Pseudothermotoga sp.]HBJ80353.1 PadR family transcriptional regulator [Pseudothermotoga sp.]